MMKPTALVTTNVRFRGACLDQREQDHHHDAGRDQHEDQGRAPGIAGAAEARKQHDRRQARRQHGRAQVIDLVVNMLARSPQHGPDDHERDRAEWKVDVEDPAPREAVDEKAAEQRADHGREAEYRAEVPLVATAVAGRDDVPDDRHRRDHQPAAAETL
jgi:hypothetical protein